MKSKRLESGRENRKSKMGTKRSGAKIEIHLEEGDDHEDEAVGGETTSEHLQHHMIKSGGHFLSLLNNKSVIFSPFLDFRQVGLSVFQNRSD